MKNPGIEFLEKTRILIFPLLISSCGSPNPRKKYQFRMLPNESSCPIRNVLRSRIYQSVKHLRTGNCQDSSHGHPLP